MGDRTNYVSIALTGTKERGVSEAANHSLGACGAVKLGAQFKKYTFCFEIPLEWT